MISTENGFNDTGNAYNTRESIFRNCAVHQIDDVFSPLTSPKVLRISLHAETLIAVK